MLVAVAFWVLLGAASLAQTVLPISGTFIDPLYDARLTSSNGPGLVFSCSDWTEKIREMRLEVVVFQTVHDNRFGAFYPSRLPFMKPWAGRCADVVQAVLEAASKVILSCEFVGTENDPVSDPVIMAKRIQIMHELAARYAKHPSFYGWYFASEAYLSPYFQPSFLDYVGNLTTAARSVTPHAVTFISPYGTRFAVNDATFVKQLIVLKSIGVDVIAYQDEVGCVRDPLPVETAASAFATLAEAHQLACGPALWANIETFTWRDRPNNDTSPLIPASGARILRQMVYATRAGCERLITFSRQGICEPSDSPLPWAPRPDGPRQFEDYRAVTDTFPVPLATSVALASASGSVRHAGIGATVAFSGADCRVVQASNLTDGLTGPLSPYSPRWLAYSFSYGAISTCSVSVMLAREMPIESVSLSFLQVSRQTFPGGDGNNPEPRNVTAYLPAAVSVTIDGQHNFGSQETRFWTQELYDTRTEVYVFSARAVRGRHVTVTFKAAVPKWATGSSALPPPSTFQTMLDEVIVNPIF
jgi:hypothetical protein